MATSLAMAMQTTTKPRLIVERQIGRRSNGVGVEEERRELYRILESLILDFPTSSVAVDSDLKCVVFRRRPLGMSVKEYIQQESKNLADPFPPISTGPTVVYFLLVG